MKHAAQPGWSLLELSIVLVMVSVIGFWSFPMIQSATAKIDRSRACTALLESAQWLERAAGQQGAYPLVLPATVWQSDGLKYSISLQSDGHTYLLTAIPNAAQANDPCGQLTLNQLGMRGVLMAQWQANACWPH
jgi:type IV pilus assembly protein PilE